MAKEYEMIGSVPIVVDGYGRVAPGAGKFKHELSKYWEDFFVKIGALKVVRELGANESVTEPAYKKDSWPTSYPKFKHEQEEQGEV